MNRKIIYAALLVIFAAASGFIIFKYNKERKEEQQKIYALLPRTAASAKLPEWNDVQLSAKKLMAALELKRTDAKSMLSLIALYLSEARITGNYSYYDHAALKLVDELLATDPKNFEALTFKAMIFLSQHHFAEALVVIKEAEAINPYSAFLYGLMVDAHVEMGQYTEALAAADKMISIRPDLRSYARISYLREIHGDYPGAIEAMKMAVDAGQAGDETTEWTRVQLGKLYELTGDLLNAEMNYTLAIVNRPGYAYANAGLARIAAAKKDYSKAIAYYQAADTVINDYSFKEAMAALYAVTGKEQQANVLDKEVIVMMEEAFKQSKTYDSVGHYADREMAYAYLNVNNTDKALEHALMEYDRRPANIDVNEVLAWVYYNKGEFNTALKYIETALRTQSKNPELLCRAAMIYAKNNQQVKAKELLQVAVKNNPSFSVRLKIQVDQLLKTI
ncbi:MAG: tetratricopeptide repeat protein [Chitinophagaceae bacterium]|jgi:tetratricopeptide (TPR) repeat protein|nr:tetratricopeptide repeat protein [Chitinophagaceae bacterium]